MRKVLALIFVLFAFPLHGQTDPKDAPPAIVVASTSSTITSGWYAVSTVAPNETIWFQLSGSGSPAGTVSVEGTLDSEAAVKANTATTAPVTSGTTIPGWLYVESPPSYLRVVVTPSNGTVVVKMRGSGVMRFRLVQ